MELSNDGRTVYLRVSFWLDDDGSIRRIGQDVGGFAVTVTDNPKRADGHKLLHFCLAKCLQIAGAPAPDLG